jgi:hypothetical protein
LNASIRPQQPLFKVRDHDRPEYGRVGVRLRVERGCCLLRFKDGSERWISKESLERIRGVVQ